MNASPERQDCSGCGFELQADFRFCPGCGRELDRPTTCPECGQVADPGAKFCSECGASLQPRERRTRQSKRRATPQIVEVPPPPDTGITIEFPSSTSQTFEFAVQEAAKHPSFAQFGEGKKAIYRATYLADEIEAAVGLVEQLKGWRRRTVYIDGEKIQWQSAFQFVWCHEKKRACFKPEFYCFGYEQDWQFNIWGCIQADLPFRENAEWFCWGHFLNQKGEWQFDKERIRHELQKKLHAYRHCPALDSKRVLEVFDAFPDKVNPRRNKNWKYVESWDSDGSPGLVITTKQHGFQEKVVMKGVSPNGLGALKEIGKGLSFRFPALKA